MRELLRAKLLQEKASNGYNPLNGTDINHVNKLVSAYEKEEFDRQAFNFRKRYFLN